MFESVMEHIDSLPPEDIESMCLEDMALCAAWYASHEGDQNTQERWQALPQALDQWAANVKPTRLATEGGRQQPILRYLIDELQAMRLPLMDRGQVDFLTAVHQLLARAANPDTFARVHELIDPHVNNVHLRRAALEPVPGLTTLMDDLRIVTPRDIQAAPPRDVRYFAAIDMHVIGPVLVHKGKLKVLGDVPENGTVVVEDGPCWVTGYVVGRVAATKDCEIHENIAGTVVVSDGDIRTRNVLQNAFVVSKLGAVRARSASLPQHVHAGRHIHVAENAALGKYTAPDIVVGGAAHGGEFHVCRQLTASQFRCDNDHALTIVLRSDISGSDYGEILPSEAGRLMARARRLSRRLQNLKHMMALAERETEHWANSALMYLAGGEKARGEIEALEKARRRMSFLDRIIASLESLSAVAQDNLRNQDANRDESAGQRRKTPEEEGGAGFEDVEQEWTQLAANGDVDPDLSLEHREIASINQTLTRQRSNVKHNSMLFVRLHSKLFTWLQERELLDDAIRRKEKALENVSRRAERLQHKKREESKVQLLKQLLVAIKTRPDTDPLAERARAVFVRVLLRSIESRLERKKYCERTANEVRKELKTTNGQLRARKLPVFAEERTHTKYGARVSGRFQPGAKICTDLLLLKDPTLPPGAVVEVPDTGDKPVTYARQSDRIVVLS
ncbi:MAG TPA: hypothetical protein HPP77_04175 [Candidatus Hydrogenedentes bacterium]|nr:hypothetical protein [Candidatus Hydrogenedentota bacterium]HIJ73423.1 hypothetical protein [Candidatus Hydrogenedentota bacterium]